MGNNVSASPSAEGVDYYREFPQIKHADVTELYGKVTDQRDVQVINHTMTLISQVTARYGQIVLRDAQIAVYGYNFKAFLYSGDRTNKFVVHFDGTNNPTYSVQEKGWRLLIRDAMTSVWELIKSTIRGGLQIGGAAARLAINY